MAGSFLAIATLVAVSFFAFVAGTVLRKWPDKVQEHLETIDGSFVMLTAGAQRTAIQTSGIALTVLSIAALIATRFVA